MPYAKPPTEIVYRPIEQLNPIRGTVQAVFWHTNVGRAVKTPGGEEG